MDAEKLFRATKTFDKENSWWNIVLLPDGIELKDHCFIEVRFFDDNGGLTQGCAGEIIYLTGEELKALYDHGNTRVGIAERVYTGKDTSEKGKKAVAKRAVEAFFKTPFNGEDAYFNNFRDYIDYFIEC